VGNRSLVEAGDVVLAALPSHSPSGREQEGTRPVVVAGVPPEPLRYPVVVVVPLTTQRGTWAEANPAIYPTLEPGAGGLPAEPTVLLDQVRAIDARRVVQYLGTLSKKRLWTPQRRTPEGPLVAQVATVPAPPRALPLSLDPPNPSSTNVRYRPCCLMRSS